MRLFKHPSLFAAVGFKHLRFAVVALALLACGASARAQELVSEAPGGELSRARDALITSTQEHKTGTEEMLRLKESEISRETAKLEQLRQLLADGIIARSDFEESERALAAAREEAEALRQQLADSDKLIAEVRAAEELAKRRPAAGPSVSRATKYANGYSTSAPLIRYTGKTGWSFADLSGLQAFFSTAFGRPLPVSAVGQSATHDRMGYDHRHAVDVALHPDSPEGRALIGYLQSRGIAFMAFRTAIPGSATGPHIHIGRPSGRFV